MLNGIVLLNKPRGISSNSAVNIVKKCAKADKAGHLGTLDVAGEGLLPVTLGKCTKLFDFFLNKDKVYETVFEFGWTTDTLDLEGELTNKNEVIVTKDTLENVCKDFVCTFDQMPPQYSAKKIGGRKAYDLAREGKIAELKPKTITIYGIKVLEELDKNVFKLSVHCSSGTYIRSLCRDIAEKLSTYGVMRCILRTKCGNFCILDSYTLNQVREGNFKIISADQVFNYDSININKQQKEKLCNGINIRIDKKDGNYKFYDENKVFVGVVNVQNNLCKFIYRNI